VGFLFAVLPMQDINEWLFDVKSKDETHPYEQVEAEFDNVNIKFIRIMDNLFF